MIARLMWVNFFANAKTNIGNLPLSHWKTIEILKTVRFQSLNFTSKPKEKSDEAMKRRSKLFKLEKGKVC